MRRTRLYGKFINNIRARFSWYNTVIEHEWNVFICCTSFMNNYWDECIYCIIIVNNYCDRLFIEENLWIINDRSLLFLSLFKFQTSKVLLWTKIIFKLWYCCQKNIKCPWNARISRISGSIIIRRIRFWRWVCFRR